MKHLKSEMKTLTIVVGHSNIYTVSSIPSEKFETVESGFEFMAIKGYKILFK
jgi:hypothetical protein